MYKRQIKDGFSIKDGHPTFKKTWTDPVNANQFAEELIKQGDEAYNGGHDVHMGLLKKEANGERNGEAPLILLHAEDQMAGTETMRVMATELIEIHKQLQVLQA